MRLDAEEDRLTKQADLSRARLLAAVDLLDQKREELSHPMRMLSRKLPREPVVYISLGLAVFSLAGALAWFNSRKDRRRPVLEKQLRRLNRRAPPPSFWGEVANRSAKALTSYAIARAGKAAINRASGRLERGALRQNQLAAF